MLEAQPDDITFLAQRGPDVAKQRILMERAIIRKLLADLAAAGCKFRLSDGEEWSTPITTDPAVVMAELMATDEELLSIWHPLGDVFFVLFVYGNDGYDVIYDTSSHKLLDELLVGCEALAEQFSEEAT